MTIAKVKDMVAKGCSSVWGTPALHVLAIFHSKACLSINADAVESVCSVEDGPITSVK